MTWRASFTRPYLTGAFSNDCANITQFDSVTGNATLDVDSMVLGKGRITGQRFCHPMAPTRYDITLQCDYLIIEPFPGQKLVASGRVNAVGLASESEVLKDDELTWNIKGHLIVDLTLGSALAANDAVQTEFRMIDTRVDFAATFSKDKLVTDFSVAVVGGFTFASGDDPSAPFVALSGNFKFNFPCMYGDVVSISNVDGEVNVGSFTAALGKSRLTFYCVPAVGDQVYDVSVVLDSVAVGPLEVTDVNVTGSGILLESGASTFTGSVSGSLEVEGFSVDAFFLIDSATQSVKPTLRMKYEADGLKMELFFATALRGSEISCVDVSVITGSLEVNVAGGNSGRANTFKAKVNGYYNCSDGASPAIFIDAVATASLPVAGIFVNHAHVRLEGFPRELEVTAITGAAFKALKEDDDAAAVTVHDARLEEKIISICHMGGKLFSQPDASELIGVFSHPGVKCDPKVTTTDYTLDEPVGPEITTRVDNASDVAPRRAVFGTQEGSCCNANNDASVALFGKDASLCCDLGTMTLKTNTTDKRCTATRWCNVGTSCQKARDVDENEECPTKAQQGGAELGRFRTGQSRARLGAISEAEKIAERSAIERTFCYMDKKLFSLSDLEIYGAYPVPRCTPAAPEVKLFRNPDPPDVIVTNAYTKTTTVTSQVTKSVTKGGKKTTTTSIIKSVKSVTGTIATVTTVKTVPIEGILDNIFFRGFFFGEAEIQQAADVGLPAGADAKATVAISFSAMNPPMDFQLDEMVIEAEFNMKVEKVIRIQGACKFTYPLRTPMPVTAWVDFDFNIPGIDFPRLEANITIYPENVPAAEKKGRSLTASLRAATPFGFTYAGIDVEVNTMVATLTVFDNGRIEGSFTAKPSLGGGDDSGGAKVNVDMVIIAKFWMDRGDAFNMDAVLSAQATLDIEDKYFGVHLSGGASTACKPEGLNLQGTFWFQIPGVVDSRLDGVLSVVKLCGDNFNGDGIPMLSAYVGIPEWHMGAGVTVKDLFVHVFANPGAGGETDVATFSWFGDFAGSIDMDSGGLMPPGMGVFGEMSITVSMTWGFNVDAGLTLGQITVAASAVFVIGNPKHEDVRLEVDARFTVPCLAGDVIEANATLTVHAVSGDAALLSIPGASVAGAYTSPLCIS